jgi:hypothetical protein
MRRRQEMNSGRVAGLVRVKGGEFRAGDWARVKSPQEIQKTLDDDGMLEGLPFMPEMLRYCGQRLRVKRRAEKACVEYADGRYKLREFLNNNVYVLETLRCSGEEHDGCQRACLLFWKRDWLEDAADRTDAREEELGEVEAIRKQLRTRAGLNRYVCQSTELARATKPLTRARILGKCIYEVRSGSRGLSEMAALVFGPGWRKLTRVFPKRRLVGTLKRTPVEHLELEPGELVTIKDERDIAHTLDTRGKNRGLTCDLGMSHHSGEQHRVRHRLERMVSEGTGEMRRVQATVVLEGLNCSCSNVLGGCPREDFMYWREIWLKRNEERKEEKVKLAARASAGRA